MIQSINQSIRERRRKLDTGPKSRHRDKNHERERERDRSLLLRQTDWQTESKRDQKVMIDKKNS